jgi:hypothetical protein
MEHPKVVGDRSTLAIMAALRAAGFALYLPFGENTRTDLVIDDYFAIYCPDTGGAYLIPTFRSGTPVRFASNQREMAKSARFAWRVSTRSGAYLSARCSGMDRLAGRLTET